jgi:AraC-like DNA-binding protein
MVQGFRPDRGRPAGAVQQGSPTIVFAATHRMKPDEVLYNRYVESLCFIWTVDGRGVVDCNGESIEARTESIVRLPWGHEVRCRANRSSFFHFGVLHVIPWLSYDEDFVPRVAVHRKDPLMGSTTRRPDGAPDGVTVIAGSSPVGGRIRNLSMYAVERFLAETTEEGPLRSLGALIMDESALWDRSTFEHKPSGLNIMTQFVEDNLRSSLTVPMIAAAARVSTPTAQRLFARYTGMSVGAWLRNRRMKEAAILLRSTSMHVREVATHVGISDPYYFSRAFSATYGVPPSRYASEAERI